MHLLLHNITLMIISIKVVIIYFKITKIKKINRKFLTIKIIKYKKMKLLEKNTFKTFNHQKKSNKALLTLAKIK